MLHVEVGWITGDPLRLDDAASYVADGARPAVEGRRGSLGTSLLTDPEAGSAVFESFWASHGALLDSEDVIGAALTAAAQRTDGTVTRARYQVLVFEREASLHGGRGVRMTRLNVKPSQLSAVEDAVAWYGDTAVPVLADTDGFCAALLYADWSSGSLISETVWRDTQALAASRGAAVAGEAAAAEAVSGAVGGSAGYRLVFSSARPY